MYSSQDVMQQLEEQSYNTLGNTTPFFMGLLKEESKEGLGGLYLLGKEVRAQILASANTNEASGDACGISLESINQLVREEIKNVLNEIADVKQEVSRSFATQEENLTNLHKVVTATNEEWATSVSGLQKAIQSHEKGVVSWQQTASDHLKVVSDNVLTVVGTLENLETNQSTGFADVRLSLTTLPTIASNIDTVKASISNVHKDVSAYKAEIDHLQVRLQELILSANRAYADAVDRASAAASQSTSLSSAIRSFDDVLASVTRYIDNLEQLRSYAEQISLAAVNSREAGEFIKKNLDEYSSWFSGLSSNMRKLDDSLTVLCANVNTSSRASNEVKDQLSEAVNQLRRMMSETCDEIVTLTATVNSASVDQKELMLRQQNINVAATVLDNLTRVGCSAAASKQEELNRQCQVEISKRRVFS